MKKLQHSPDKYPHLEDYSGFEIVEDLDVEGKMYPHAQPIYSDGSGDGWLIQIPLYVNSENDGIVLFNIRAQSAKALVAAVNAIHIPVISKDEE